MVCGMGHTLHSVVLEGVALAQLYIDECCGVGHTPRLMVLFGVWQSVRAGEGDWWGCWAHCNCWCCRWGG